MNKDALPTHIAARIRLLILDVDGVLTDGTLVYSETGELTKNFNAKDGFGIRMLHEHGVEIAVITARNSPALARRMADLNVRHFHAGCDDKLVVYDRLLETLNIHSSDTGYVGDDILDLPVMNRVALPIAVNDAHWVVKKNACMVTDAPGGHGAVREVADILISSRTDLEQAYKDFLDTHIGNTKMDTL